MAQYDGTIRIATRITTKDAEESLASLEWQIKKSAKYMDELRSKMDVLKNQKIPTEEYKELEKELAEAKKNLKELISEQEQYEELGVTSGGAWDSLNAKIANASDNVDSIKEKMQSLVDAGKDFTLGEDTEEYKSYERQLKYEEESVEKAAEHYKRLLADEDRLAKIKENATVSDQELVDLLERRKELLQRIAELTKAGVTEGYLEYDTAVADLSDVQEQINSIRDARESTDKVRASYVRLGETVKQAFKIMAKGFVNIPIAAVKAGIHGLAVAFRKLGSIIKKMVIGSFKVLGSVAKNVLSGTKTIIGKIVSGIKSIGGYAKKSFSRLGDSAKKTNNALSTMSSRLRETVLSFLVFDQVRKIISGITSSVEEGFENLYKDNEKFKSSVDSLKASVLTLKNSLAAAFRPLVDVAIPYIKMATDYLTNLSNKIGQFIAAITGQKTYTKAINQTTEAIEEENEAQNKQLSGLDKLNNLSSSTGGSDTKGDGGAMFEEEVPIDSGILGIFEKLKSLIESKDWEGLGAYIAGALNEGLQKIYDIINWNNVGPYITSFIDAFTRTFNSLVDNLDWNSLGKTIGAGINTIVNTLYLLITGIDWINLGKKIAEAINGLANEVDAGNLGKLIGEKLMILPRILLGFVSELDWGLIGTKIATSLNGVVSAVDLSQVGELLGRSLTGIFQTAITFASTFDWTALGTNIYQGINSFFQNTNWATIAQGVSAFLIGLLDFFITTVQGVDWKQIGESIKTFATNIDWMGLLEKITAGRSEAITGLATLLFEMLKDAWNNAMAWWNESVSDFNWDAISARIGNSLKELVDGINWNSIGQAFGNGINILVDILLQMVTGIDWVNLGKNSADGVNGLVSSIDFTDLGTLIGENLMVLPRILLGFVSKLEWGELGVEIGNALNGVINAIDLSQLGDLLGTGLTGIFQAAINFSATFSWEDLGTNIYQGINSFFSNTDWKTVGKGISDFVMGILDTILVTIEGIDWMEVGRSIVEFILSIDWIGLALKLWDIGVALIDGILKGILGALVGIGQWLKEHVFDPIIGWFKDLFGIHSPSTVMAEIGGFIIEGMLNGILDALKSIGSWIKQHIFQPFINGFKNAFDIHSPSKVMEGLGGNIIDGLLNGLKNAWKDITSWIEDKFKWIKDKFSGIGDGVGGFFDKFRSVDSGESYSTRSYSMRSIQSPYAANPAYAALSSTPIPRLATGTVVPPNREFLAVLGDNKRETEVVSPLSTIEQAVENVMSRIGSIGGGEITIKVPVIIDGKTVTEIVAKYDKEHFDRTGEPLFSF